MKRRRPHHETAAGLMVADVPRARAGEHAGAILDRLALAPIAGDWVYVLEAGLLRGRVRVADLVSAARDRPVSATPCATCGADEDQEHVATICVRHRLSEVPVLDAAGRFVGVVPAEQIIQVLRREHLEDLHKLAGIRHDSAQARHAMDASPFRSAKERLPWLLVGLAGSAAATAVMARFEHVLAARVEVALFVPGIVYLADAIGTQTETIAVRGLSLSRVSLPKFFAHEAQSGLIIGLTLAALVMPAVWLAWGDVRLACAVAIAVVVAGFLAGGIGLLLPWTLARMGRDPALGSGPVATVIQDVLSLVVYFGTVSVLL